MSVENGSAFAEEFSRMIIRWTRGGSNDSDKVVVALTNDQVKNVVDNVLSAIFGTTLSETDNSSVKTPASGISVCTPNAPVGPKQNGERNGGTMGRYRSLDTLTNVGDHETQNNRFQFPNQLSSKSEEVLDSMDTDNPNSRSVPAINVCGVKRSDTFVREDDIFEEPKTANEVDCFEKTKSNFSADTERTCSGVLVKRLETLKKNASDMVSKIEDIKKLLYPRTTKPTRRLSSIGFSGVNRASPLMKPVPPPKLRRCSSAFPGTPTSSKPNLITSNDRFLERRSISKASITPKKPKFSVQSPAMSETSVNLTGRQSVSPGSKLPKNPKFAHVKSTIPKATTGKRKGQS